MLGNEIISAISQVLVFSLIPFVVYVIKYKSVKGFSNYIGLKKSTTKANLLALLVMLIIAVPILTMTLLNNDFKEIMTHPNSVTGKIRQLGFSIESGLIVLFIAILKTSLAEEILFRGFVAKRLIAITNFKTGNIIQAVIFGVIHTLIFMTISSNGLFLFMIFLFPALGAYYKTYLNEKLANGSIIPGWIAHGSGNILSYSIVGFVM